MEIKQKSNKIYSQAGFTLVELLAVLAISSLLLGALVIDFAGQRGRRNLVLAKNETITNLRKVQSYMLSSRNISPGVPAKYYIATLTSGSASYTIQAVDNDFMYHDNIETINLPSKVNISTLAIPSDNGDRSGEAITIIVDEQTIQATSYNCIQIIFSAPFGKMYTHGSDICNSSIIEILKDPVQISQLNENSTYVFLSDSDEDNDYSAKGNHHYLELQPITGQMTAK